MVEGLEPLSIINENIDIEGFKNISDQFLSDLSIKANNDFTNGRIIIRPSGTEPVIRISIEYTDEDAASLALESIVKTIKENG